MHYLQINKIVFWLFLCLCLNTLVHVHVQAQSFVQLNREPEFTIASGEEQLISLSFLIKEGYHIQTCQVKDENLIPTVLSIDATDALILGDPIFPQAVEFRMKGVEEALDVYSDVLEINIPVRASKSAEQGEVSVNGKLHYQACDDSKCYFPRDLHFSMKINIQ